MNKSIYVCLIEIMSVSNYMIVICKLRFGDVGANHIQSNLVIPKPPGRHL